MARRWAWAPTPARLLEDERAIELSDRDRLVLHLLYPGADEWGRFPASPTPLRLRLGLLGGPCPMESVRVLAAAGLVQLYEADGRPFGYLVGFDEDDTSGSRARRPTSAFPQPPEPQSTANRLAIDSRPNADRPPTVLPDLTLPDPDKRARAHVREPAHARAREDVSPVVGARALSDTGSGPSSIPSVPDGVHPDARAAVGQLIRYLHAKIPDIEAWDWGRRSASVMGPTWTWGETLRHLATAANEDPEALRQVADNVTSWKGVRLSATEPGKHLARMAASWRRDNPIAVCDGLAVLDQIMAATKAKRDGVAVIKPPVPGWEAETPAQRRQRQREQAEMDVLATGPVATVSDYEAGRNDGASAD